MAVQSEVRPMTDLEWKPLRTRVMARESLVILLVPAQTSSRNGDLYFAAPGPYTTTH